jgi:hypothetical protein
MLTKLLIKLIESVEALNAALIELDDARFIRVQKI